MRKEKNLFQRFGIFLVTVVLVILAITITMNRDLLNLDGFRRWLLYGDLELSAQGESEAFAHGGGEQSSFALSSQGVMMVSKSGSRYYSFRGGVFTERVVSYTNPVLHSGGQGTVLYDAGGKVLSVYSEEVEKFALGLGSEDTVLTARMNGNDWLVVVTQESGYKGVVTIYDNLFHTIMEIGLSTTFVMDACISPDNKQVAVVTVGQSGGVFESKLLIYDVAESTDSPKETMVFTGKVILDMDYESDYIWLLSEKELILVDIKDYSRNSWSFSGSYLKDANLEGDGFATLLLGQYRAGTANRLVTIDGSGKVLGDLAVTNSPLALSSAGQYIAYLAGERFVLYTPELKEYAVLEDVNHANETAVSPDGTVLLASPQEAWLFLPQVSE